MTTDNYDAEGSLVPYYPDRDSKRPNARLWSIEKTVHDLAAVGVFEFFEGPGPNPTLLSGYGSTKIWLKQSAGVQTTPGTVHSWNGESPASDPDNWPEITPGAAAAWPPASSVNAAIASAAAALASETDAETAAIAAGASAVSADASADAALAAAQASGAITFYDTKAAANAALSGLSNNTVIEVLADESYYGLRTRYRKEAGVYVFKLAIPGFIGGGVQQAASKRKGTLVTVGDSNYCGRVAFYPAIVAEWRHEAAPFALWTHYNMAVSGFQVGGLVNSIGSGDENEAPSDHEPAVPPDWSGNIYTIVNANPDVIVFGLGINDFNSPGSRSVEGAAFTTNLDTAINFLLDNTTASILMAMPAPYAGEDFITGMTNVTDWAADAPVSEPTIDGNAAFCSAKIRAAYLTWHNRHPRVAVWDSAELFGTRIDDKTTDGQDPEGQGALLDDSLHFGNIGARRIVQSLSRMLGFPPKRATTETALSTTTLHDDVVWGRWFRAASGNNVSADTFVTLYPSTEHIFTETRLNLTRSNSMEVPQSRLYDAEMAYYLSSFGIVRELLALTTNFKLYFPDSNTHYTPTAVSLSQSITTSSTRQFEIKFFGVDLSGETFPCNMLVYTTKEQSVPFLRRSASFTIAPSGGAMFNPQNTLWYPTTFTFARGDATNSISVAIYAFNQSDGRLVESGMPGTPYTAPGAVVASGSVSSGVYEATLTANTTDFPSGFNWKAEYRLIGRVTSGTLVGSGTFVLR